MELDKERATLKAKIAKTDSLAYDHNVKLEFIRIENTELVKAISRLNAQPRTAELPASQMMRIREDQLAKASRSIEMLSAKFDEVQNDIPRQTQSSLKGEVASL